MLLPCFFCAAYTGSTAQRQLKAQLPGFTLPFDQCDVSTDACPSDKPFVGSCSDSSCDVNPNPGAVCIEFDADSESTRACCPQQSAAGAPTQQGTAATPDQQNATTMQEQPNGTTGSTGSDNGGQRRKLAQAKQQVPIDQCDRVAQVCTPEKPLGACCDEETNMCDIVGPAIGQNSPGKGKGCIGSALVSMGCCPAQDGTATDSAGQMNAPNDAASTADSNPASDP